MTKLGANVHSLIGVHTRISFSAWWCTEAEKKSSFLLTRLKESRLVHVHVRWLINSWSLTKPVETIMNTVKLHDNTICVNIWTKFRCLEINEWRMSTLPLSFKLFRMSQLIIAWFVVIFVDVECLTALLRFTRKQQTGFCAHFRSVNSEMEMINNP